MSNVVDSAVSEAEDGRKGQGPRGPRPVYFYAVPKDMVLEEVEFEGDKWSLEEAKAALEAKVGSGAKVIGPLHKVKTGVAKADSASLVVKVDLRNRTFTAKKYVGTFENYHFFANGIAACVVNGESFADNELINIQIEDRVDTDIKSPKPRISNKIVRRSHFTDISES